MPGHCQKADKFLPLRQSKDTHYIKQAALQHTRTRVHVNAYVHHLFLLVLIDQRVFLV